MLVLTTVHQAEDPRIRHRTVAVLARDWTVRYATAPPPPVNPRDHQWRPLPGRRARRWLAAAREAWRRDVALVSVHDPELVPLAVVVRLLRGTPVVVDVHEDVPAQLRTKAWLPRPLRAPLAWAAHAALRVAERVCTVTLAEPNYARLFASEHPVLPNYPDPAALPDPADDDGWVVYVGDVTVVRGVLVALEAVARLDAPRRLRLIGRCPPELAARLRARADEAGVELDLPGFLPHPEAMARLAGATVGLSPLAAIPNYERSLPTKTLEYLGAGVPVVASDLPGTREVLDDLPGATLAPPPPPSGEPSDDVVAAWAERIAAVRADVSVRDDARRAATLVRERLTWPGHRMREVYADALASRRR